ncbi:MAG TPA: hypothetical protein VLX92_08605 [Kofleriaceae bacterium]|nr:hypothetical protein [Kofleriaceae bacterium]
MRQLLIAIALAASAGVVHAQPAGALGHPLPGPDLDTGTVSVRVIAGSPQNAVSGTEVTLIVNGTPRVARTDDGGRAFFKDLPAGATVQAKITDEDQKEVSSDSFPLPGQGGVKVMLSTRPVQGGMMMGGAPFAGGGAGMPEPRQLSGEPRPEPNDPPGSYTVRLTYDDFKDAPPVDVPVTLVGYSADNSIEVQIVRSDKEGRAQFTGLDRTGATSYFAMTQLPRAGAIDRLIAQPVVMVPQVGVRVALSSDKRTSSAPPIDDLASDPTPTPAGKVRVSLTGVPDPDAEITLVDAATKAVIGKGGLQPGPPDPQDIQGGAPFEPKPDLPAGTLAIDARGGVGNATDPLAHVQVRVIPADAKDAPADAPMVETGADGTAKLEHLPASSLKAVLTINGRNFETNAFELAKSGGALHIQAQWPSQGKPEAVIDLIPKPGQVVYAETAMRGEVYRSRPFEQIEGRGAHLQIQILPRVIFSFTLQAHVDDEYLAVQGRFEVYNNSWAPYVAGPDGLTVPLPTGFKGAVLAEQDQADVAAVPGEGFRLARPVPPGARRFIGAFSLPVEHGQVDWHLDLPYGAFESELAVTPVPGMVLGKLPPSVHTETIDDSRGHWIVVPRITILPKQSMELTVSGLPSDARWKLWVPRILGLLVVSLMASALVFALVRRRSGSPARAARRQALLDQLVALDQSGRNDKRREALLAELEKLWDD